MTEKAKHAPAPWQAYTNTGFVRDANNNAVAAIFGKHGGGAVDEVMGVNTRLIAAAADLLEALKDTMFDLMDASVRLNDPKKYAETIKQAEAVIAKAKGE